MASLNKTNFTLIHLQKRFMERHRKMMDDFMADRTKEAEELQHEHDEEVRRQREAIEEYEKTIEECEETIQHLETAHTEQASVCVQTEDGGGDGDGDGEKEDKARELQDWHEELLQAKTEEFEQKMKGMVV